MQKAAKTIHKPGFPVIYCILFLFLSISACKDNKPSGTEYITLDGFAQGGTYHIVYKIPDPTGNKDVATGLPDSLSQYFENINKSISGYDSLSIITKINNGEDIPLDDIFTDVFNESYRIYNESGGAFDVSAGPFFNLWGFGFRHKEQVTQAKIDSLMQFVGMEKLSIEGGRLKKACPGIQINFNAIAQGYTCDYIARKFDAMGITDYLIEVGGEIYCKGLNPKGKEWKVAIDKPVDGNFIPGESIESVLLLSDKGLVTSGNYRKFYIENGVKYSHTIDPRTGYPVKHNLLSATVIAGTAAIADAYATYFMVVGLEKAKEILAVTPGVEALLVYGEQDNMKVYSTPGIRPDDKYKIPGK